jgi:hypothetical protein
MDQAPEPVLEYDFLLAVREIGGEDLRLVKVESHRE